MYLTALSKQILVILFLSLKMHVLVKLAIYLMNLFYVYRGTGIILQQFAMRNEIRSWRLLTWRRLKNFSHGYNFGPRNQISS